MLFQRQRAGRRQSAWDAFAERLELEDAAGVAERLRRWLDLRDVTLDPVYALRRDAQPTLYLFEYVRERTGPTGSVAQRVWCCLLRADATFAPLALRAHPKRNKVMESLEASRTGSSIVELPTDCGDAVTVFARDPERAARVVAGPVCAALRRALEQRGAESVVVGESHVLAVTEPDGEAEESAGLDRLEALAADVLAVYALMGARSGTR